MRIDHTVTDVTPASIISRADFRTYARAVNITGEDDLIDRQLEASTRYVETYIGQSLNENRMQAIIWDFDDERDMDNGELRYALPMGPVTSITSVVGQDLEGANTTLTADSDYYLLTGGRLRIPSPTAYSTYTISYVAQLSYVTENIKEAIIKICAELYQNRGISVTGTIVSNLKADLNSLLAKERTKLFL